LALIYVSNWLYPQVSLALSQEQLSCALTILNVQIGHEQVKAAGVIARYRLLHRPVPYQAY
jgi:hypothetical protein